MGAGLFRRTAPVSSPRLAIFLRGQSISIDDTTARNRSFWLRPLQGTAVPYFRIELDGARLGIDAGVVQGVTRNPGLVGG